LPVVPRFSWRFTPDSASIITCDHDGRVFRWEGRDFREPRLLLEMGAGIMSALVSEDGRTVAASFQNGVIRVWDLAERALRREMDTRDGSTMLWGFADESNRLLAVSDRDQSLHEWNLASGVEEIPGPGLEDWQIRGAFPIASRHHYAGRSVAAYFDRVGATGTRRHSHQARRWFMGAFSHDQRYFAYQHTVGTVVVEDAKTSRELATLRGFLQGVHSLAFSPDGQRLAVGSDDRQAVKLWDLESFQELVTLGGNGTAYSQTRFSPDGSVLGTMNSRGILHLWRAPSWEAIATAERALERELGPSHSGNW
jgi:WD40 repeat protein